MPEVTGQSVEIIGEFAEVFHSYLRSDTFNILFTTIAIEEKRIEDNFEQIRPSLSLHKSQFLDLPVRRLFKLDARFEVSRGSRLGLNDFLARKVHIIREVHNRPALQFFEVAFLPEKILIIEKKRIVPVYKRDLEPDAILNKSG